MSEGLVEMDIRQGVVFLEGKLVKISEN